MIVNPTPPKKLDVPTAAELRAEWCIASDGVKEWLGREWLGRTTGGNGMPGMTCLAPAYEWLAQVQIRDGGQGRLQFTRNAFALPIGGYAGLYGRYVMLASVSFFYDASDGDLREIASCIAQAEEMREQKIKGPSPIVTPNGAVIDPRKIR